MAMIDVDLLLTWGATYRKVSKGEVIFREGANASFYFQLDEGRVKWVSIDDDGKEYIQAIAEDGESFGELALFDEGVYATTAIAEEDSIVLRLHKNNFMQLIKDNPEIHFAFTRLLTERLRFRFMMAKELAFHNPEQRVRALIEHYKQRNHVMAGATFPLQLTRQQIAGMTGLRVETVIRTIRNLYDRGALVIEKGKVYC
jgi:CRP-like cAMP-binding protein